MNEQTSLGDCTPLTSSRPSIDRWQLLDLVKATRAYLGVKDREIAVLAAHLSVLPKGPIETRGRQLSYMKVSDILSRACCMEPKRFRLGELRLEECGLVLRRLSANGRRFPMRDAKGQVIDAYGIDLAPLVARVSELEDVRVRLSEEERQQKDRRTRLSCRLGELKRKAQQTGDEVSLSVLEIAGDLRNRLRRKSISIEEQREMEDRLSVEEARLGAIDTTVSSSVPPLPSQAPDPKSVDVDDASTQGSALVKNAGDDSQIDRHRESPQKDFIKEPRYDQSLVHASWTRTHQLQAYYPDVPRGEHEAGVKLQEFSGFMGLGQSIVAEMIARLGWHRTVTMLDDLASRMMKGTISRPAAYVRSVLRSYERGDVISAGRISGPRTPRQVFCEQPSAT